MLDKRIIRREISLLHFLLLLTSKLLIGAGIGMIIATHYFYAQPYWYLAIIAGALILAFTLYNLMKAEAKEEIELEKRVK